MTISRGLNTHFSIRRMGESEDIPSPLSFFSDHGKKIEEHSEAYFPRAYGPINFCCILVQV